MGYRRMILHYAYLCELAGGVDAFLIGSELRGITQVRSGDAGPFPGVDHLRTLKALEDENAKLKRLLADTMLDNVVLKDLLGKN